MMNNFEKKPLMNNYHFLETFQSAHNSIKSNTFIQKNLWELKLKRKRTFAMADSRVLRSTPGAAEEALIRHFWWTILEPFA